MLWRERGDCSSEVWKDPFVLSLGFVKGQQAPAVKLRAVPSALLALLFKSNMVL